MIKVQVTTVLVPGELDALLRRLGHVLIVEKVSRVAYCRPADIGHQVTEYIFAQSGSLVILFGDVVSLTPMADMNMIRVPRRSIS